MLEDVTAEETERLSVTTGADRPALRNGPCAGHIADNEAMRFMLCALNAHRTLPQPPHGNLFGHAHGHLITVVVLCALLLTMPWWSDGLSPGARSVLNDEIGLLALASRTCADDLRRRALTARVSRTSRVTGQASRAECSGISSAYPRAWLVRMRCVPGG
jgi:hypothetical protein